MGPEGWSAAPSVLRFLKKNAGSSSDYLVEVLVGMGSRAIPAIEQSLKSGGGEDFIERAGGVLERLRPSSAKTCSAYGAIDRKLLETFVLVAEVFEQEGSASWSQVWMSIDRKFSGIVPKGLMKRNLALRVKKLEGELGKPLVVHAKNRRGRLTPEGRVVLKEIREWLADLE